MDTKTGALQVGESVSFTRTLHLGNGQWPVTMFGIVARIDPKTVQVRIEKSRGGYRLMTVKRTDLQYVREA